MPRRSSTFRSRTAVLSYWVDEAHNGRGLCTRAVSAVMRVFEKNGFERIGLARSYLLIGGEWRDHVLFERVAD